MKNIRSSTVFCALAILAFAAEVFCSRLAGETMDTIATVLLLAVLPTFALAGAVSASILLFRDRAPLRFLELGVSIVFLVLLSRVH